jgi:predicted flap endonuclease-1-like 5' DNA nuclease
VFSQLLQDAGIRTLNDLAEATPDTVAEVISVPGVLPVGQETARSWIDQARELTSET